MNVKSYAESTAFIIGGSTGIGLATAYRLAESGVPRIALAGRTAARVRSAAETLSTTYGIPAEGFAFDATDLAATRAGVAAAEEFLGGVDIMVSSVTDAATPELLVDQPVEGLEGDLRGLLIPPVTLTRLILPGMYARGGGSIVLVASDAAKTATPGETVIGAAMAGIVMFARTVAMEAKRQGVRVNAVTPSLVAGTPTSERLIQEGFSAKLFAAATKQAALGVTVPDDVAALIAYLAGPDAARLTGQAISVNGGISAA
ncbi:SDR family NAD(P)-dependent oxidoreductase [Granulicoccus phenolivorans]|uniref:SDR family NAD(P)-dependent oxidoreductase n=1 Tax=Granulicoccus phenolivorans TaxID=266854 RepID=UPI00040E31ED|nr:SDR family oxidoreductase [Granulicoccus phenolivorans]